MQTFLPYKDFAQSAKVLDNKRLGKQRLETWQISKILADSTPLTGWRNHPVLKMWASCHGSLLEYGIVICQEWRDRGFKDNLLPKFIEIYDICPGFLKVKPWWVDKQPFHDSHQSMLLKKKPEYYGKFNWDIKDMQYVWPMEEPGKAWHFKDKLKKEKIFIDL